VINRLIGASFHCDDNWTFLLLFSTGLPYWIIRKLIGKRGAQPERRRNILCRCQRRQEDSLSQIPAFEQKSSTKASSQAPSTSVEVDLPCPRCYPDEQGLHHPTANESLHAQEIDGEASLNVVAEMEGP
jgi:hypothetical protein